MHKSVFILLLWQFITNAFASNPQLSTVNCQLSTDSVIIGDATIIGNKITKDRIILRELTFHKGDTLTLDAFEKKRIRSEQNLTNTSLFNSVHITYLIDTTVSPAGGGRGWTANIFIIVKERWYIFPVPVFEIIERNFNVWWKTKDFSRIVYGGVISWYNFRGRAETVSLGIRSGYTQSINFSYSIPYINHNQTSGLSLGFTYLRNHQIPFETFNNALVNFKDTNNFIRKYYDGAIQYTFRQGLYLRHYASIERLYTTVEDTLSKLNPDFFGHSKTTEKYYALRYFFRNDHRDLVVYPLKGFEYDIEIVKAGLPFLDDDINISYLTFNYRKYFELANRLYFAAGLRGKVSDGNYQPYFNTRALGYSTDYIRGYEFYVIDGQHFGLVRSNLKYALLPKYEFRIPYLPEKFAFVPLSFYVNLFGDAGYVVDNQFWKYNSMTNQWQYGYGVGIDLVTYYDLVFRFEYSINKFGESGFFLHFSAPI